MNMKITIAIPAFKPNFLKEAIESVLEQTYDDWELIIVNDCSPFDLLRIIAPYIEDKRVRYFMNDKNCGAINVVDNWNKCLEYSTGDYIMLIGDDDKLPVDSLKNYIEQIKNNQQCDIFHGRTVLINEESEPIYIQEARPSWESLFSAIWHRMDGRQQFIGDYLFKIRSLKEQGGFFKLPLAWGSDDITVFRSIGDKGICNCNEPCFYYRVNRFSITSSGNSIIKMKTTFLHHDCLLKILEQHNATGTDVIMRTLSFLRIDNYFLKKRIHIVANDIASNGLKKIPMWIMKRKLAKLSFKHLAYAIVEGLKIKQSMKK